MTAILIITQALNAVATIGPISVALALQIRALLQSGSEPFEVQIQAYKDGTLRNIEETAALIDQWMAEHPQ